MKRRIAASRWSDSKKDFISEVDHSPANKPMNARGFLDTNILLYAYDLDLPEKRGVALHSVEEGWAAHGETAISEDPIYCSALDLIEYLLTGTAAQAHQALFSNSS